MCQNTKRETKVQSLKTIETKSALKMPKKIKRKIILL